MFESLSDRLGKIFSGITGRGALSEADVQAALREVRRAHPRRAPGEHRGKFGKANARREVRPGGNQNSCNSMFFHALRRGGLCRDGRQAPRCPPPLPSRAPPQADCSPDPALCVLRVRVVPDAAPLGDGVVPRAFFCDLRGHSPYGFTCTA